MVADLHTEETGDDAIGATNIAERDPRCGLLVSSAEIRNSHSRGVAVAGACNATFTHLHIVGTANSGVAVVQDRSIHSRTPTNVRFAGALIEDVGTLPGVPGNKHCVDVGKASHVSASDIWCNHIADTGVSIYNKSVDIAMENVHVTSAGNNGFQSVGSNDVRFLKDRVTGAFGNGFDIEGSANVTVQDCAGDTLAGYGFYHSGSSHVTESSLAVRNAAVSKGNHRAWWAEEMVSATSVHGLTVTDDQSVATGYVVGDAGDRAAPVRMEELVFDVRHGRPSIQPSSPDSLYVPGGPKPPGSPIRN